MGWWRRSKTDLPHRIGKLVRDGGRRKERTRAAGTKSRLGLERAQSKAGDF